MEIRLRRGRCRDRPEAGPEAGSAGREGQPAGGERAGRRGSSEDDLPLRGTALRTGATDGV
jgi:hypothetical protein